ncbi:MAG TPA: CDP-alcohol phosphatidyltransferase family protein [Solirubrobacterales bacterium]
MFTSRRILLGVTASRLVFAGLFALSCLAGFRFALLPLALLAEVSDLSDGFLARRLGLASDLGNVYDGMSDHLARLTEFVSLAYLGLIGMFPVLIFLWRDGAVITVRLVAGVSHAPFPTTRKSGKLKGIAQGGCVVWLAATASIPSLSGPLVEGISKVTIFIAILVTAWSGFDYLLAHRQLLFADTPKSL